MIKAEALKVTGGFFFFWWTAIYHVDAKGQPDRPAHSTGTSPGRRLWEAAMAGDRGGMGAGRGDATVNVCCSTLRAAPDGSEPAAGGSSQRSHFQPAKHRLLLKAGTSPSRQEAAGRRNGLVITFPSTVCRRPPLAVRVFQRSLFSNLALYLITKDSSFGSSVMDQMGEGPFNSGLLPKPWVL